jgi:hypothetical protein
MPAAEKNRKCFSGCHVRVFHVLSSVTVEADHTLFQSETFAYMPFYRFLATNDTYDQI